MARKTQDRVFRYLIMTEGAPFFSDKERGSIKSSDPITALKKLVRDYNRDNTSGVFSAVVREGNCILARYLSAGAATVHERYGFVQYKRDGVYVDGKKVPPRRAVYELF